MEFNYYTIIIGYILGFMLFYKTPMLKKSENHNSQELKISVIIPARNEEKCLPNILNDLKNQSYEVHEIICVDDNSEDSTFDVIKKFNCRYTQLNILPDGWKGKPWACQNGANKAKGDVLLFLDADVRLSSTAIESLVNIYMNKQTPISVQPYHTVIKQHEYHSLFFNLIETCNTAMSLAKAKYTQGFFGPVFMISKNLFDKHGGYNKVKNNVIEDFSLGKYYNQLGINISLYAGSEEIRFRMYPDSFFNVFEAWTRNFSSGSLTTKPWLLLMTIIWIAGLTAIPIEIFKSISSGNFLASVILVLVYLVNALFIYRIAKPIGSYPLYVCLIYPLYLLTFHIIFICSLLGTFVFNSTTWKGRIL